MAFGYKITEPSGKAIVVVAEDKHNARRRVCEM